MPPDHLCYLDNSATTRPRPEAVAAATAAMADGFGNPSSLHGLGVAAERAIKGARATVAGLLGAPPGAVYFTSGGTEANNLAIQGVARTFRHRGGHIVTTAIEHASVLEACRALERDGYTVTYLPVDHEGRIQPDQVAAALTDATILVSVMHVNNEIGTVQPIADIGRLLAGRRQTLFHVDAVQSAGKLPLNVGRLGADLLTASAHKLHGVKGVGALYVRPGITLQPLLHGGGQEQGLRPGTENVPGIVAFGAAVAAARQELSGAAGHMLSLKRRVLDGLARAGLAFTVNGPDPGAGWAAPHILNLSFPGVDRGEVLVHGLEAHGVYVSTGSACHSRHVRVSHVLQALGHGGDRATGAIRLSFSPLSTAAEADAFVDAATVVVPALQAVARGRR